MSTTPADASTCRDPLEVVTLRGATAFPPHTSESPHRMHFGVLRADGSLLESSIDDRHHGEHTFIPPDPARYGDMQTVHGEAIYAGTLYGDYGHFLVESLQRLWWAAAHPELPVFWFKPVGGVTWPLVHWQRDMLDIVGVTNEVVLLDRPTRFDVLHIPDAGYKYADWTHPQHIKFLAAYAGPPQEPGSKLWLSRDSRLGVGIINRGIIESRLLARGWDVVTFESMPLREQLDALARAEVVAGEEGSTFHNLLLLADVRGKTFHIFRRRGPEHLSFTTIGDARQVDQHFHSCSQDAVLFAKGRRVTRLAPNAAQYMSHLGIPIKRASEPSRDRKPGPTARRLGRLATLLGAESYLQVGWRSRALFSQVTVPLRHVVAEEFAFDVRSYRASGQSFYEVTLEDYLTWFAEDRTFDLILVDHGQDWRRALDQVRTVFARAAHERTVVLLDNADLAKAVLALHDLDSGLTYRTMTTGRRSHAVIWQQSRQVQQRFGGEAAIEALNEADVAAHADLLAPVSEQDAMTQVRSWLDGLLGPDASG